MPNGRPQGVTERLVRAIVTEVVDRLITWADSTDDGSDDGARFECDPGDPRPVTVASPPGFYSVVATGIRGLVLRLPLGGVLLSAYTAAPGDAGAGEAGLSVGGALARLKASGVFEVTGTPAADGIDLDGGAGGLHVTRDTDPVNPGLSVAVPPVTWNMTQWIAAVTATCATGVPNPGLLVPIDFGAATATTTKVKAG